HCPTAFPTATALPVNQNFLTRFLQPNRYPLRLKTPCLAQRRPTRLTGPPRFMGVPARTPAPGAPTPTRATPTTGVATTAAATGVGRATQPFGTPTVLQ